MSKNVQYGNTVLTLFLTLACLLLVVPTLPVAALMPARARQEIRRIYVHVWAKAVVWGLGIRVRIRGAKPDSSHSGLFLVSNHFGPLDVLVLGSVWPMTFVSRHDVAGWPGVNLLTRLGGTLYANREARLTSPALVEAVTKRLSHGGHVHVFAEGVSTDGSRLLPFLSTLFEAPRRSGTVIQPVTIRYRSINGRPITRQDRDRICWYQNMAFIPHFMNVMRSRGIEVEVVFSRPLNPGGSRKQLAVEARRRVAENWRPLWACPGPVSRP